MLYPIAMAVNSTLCFALAVLWEVTLRPSNPASAIRAAK